MTDREMLLMVYGAMKAITGKNANFSSGNLGEIVSMTEEHLYPPPGPEPASPPVLEVYPLGDWECMDCLIANGKAQKHCGKCGGAYSRVGFKPDFGRPAPLPGSGLDR